MKVLSFELGPFSARCVVLADRETRESLVVDPGFDVEAVLGALARERLAVTGVVLTHAHLDHAAGVGELRQAFPAAPLRLHSADLPLYENLPMQARMFGFPVPAHVPPDGVLDEGDELLVGTHRLAVRHCPGHSPGHVVLVGVSGGAPLAVVGDVLFAGSVGRTDLWGGSFDDLARSIREVLYRLPDNTRVIPGHGPETTIGAEKATNPFVPG